MCMRLDFTAKFMHSCHTQLVNQVLHLSLSQMQLSVAWPEVRESLKQGLLNSLHPCVKVIMERNLSLES